MSNNKDVESGSAPQGASQPSALARYGLPVGLFAASLVLGITLPVCLHNKTQDDLKKLEKKLGQPQYENLVKQAEDLMKRVNYLEKQNGKPAQYEKPKTLTGTQVNTGTQTAETTNTGTQTAETTNTGTQTAETTNTGTQAVVITNDQGQNPDEKIMKDLSSYQKALSAVTGPTWEETKKNPGELIKSLVKIMHEPWFFEGLLNKDWSTEFTNTEVEAMTKLLKQLHRKAGTTNDLTLFFKDETVKEGRRFQDTLIHTLKAAINLDFQKELFKSVDDLMRSIGSKQLKAKDIPNFFAEEATIKSLLEISENQSFAHELAKKEEKVRELISDSIAFTTGPFRPPVLNRNKYVEMNLERKEEATWTAWRNFLKTFPFMRTKLKNAAIKWNEPVIVTRPRTMS